MKIYLVGGAVRDKLLGKPVTERDWVVVGATVEEMLQQGYQQVGKDFPVFLHPQSKEEYALARMERKVKPGYKGFTFDTSKNVTLEEDLIRRDLTINAMAENEQGNLIDPYEGRKDLEAKLLRHVSPAFAEDPVRILRVARFAARYAKDGFKIAPETMQLMQVMIKNGEVNALVAERVWKELERALGEPDPVQFFNVLHQCNALRILFPSIIMHDQGLQALALAANITSHVKVRFAALLHTSSKQQIQELCARYRVPTAYKNLALLTAQHYQTAIIAKNLSPEQLLDLLYALDVYRREERFNDFLMSCKAIAKMHFSPEWLQEAAHVTKSYDVQQLVAQGLDGLKLAQALKEKRLQRLKEWLALL